MAPARMVLDADFRRVVVGETPAITFTRCPCCGSPGVKPSDDFRLLSHSHPAFIEPITFVLLRACIRGLLDEDSAGRRRVDKLVEALIAAGSTLAAIASESDDGRVRADVLPAPSVALQ